MLHNRGIALTALAMFLGAAICGLGGSTARGQAAGERGAGSDARTTPTTTPAVLDERELPRLIAQLGDADFNVREVATARLLTAGNSAIPTLKKTQNETHDEEVRTRLATILAALPLWNGRETVADYVKRNGIRETELSLDLGEKVTIKVTLIPAGKFLMGSPETEKNHLANEAQHKVTISKPFYMGVTPVTVDQFAAFVKDSGYKTEAEKEGTSVGLEIRDGKLDIKKKLAGCSWRNPSFEQKGDQPVVHISWSDAKAFCDWLSKKSGKAVVLPTEAQWEYACRAGTTTAYPWGDDPDGGKGWTNCRDQSLKKKIPNANWAFVAWDDGFAFTAPVGSFKANAFGLFDMNGNAFQWCQDWQGDYGKAAATDPTGAENGEIRISRGGCWLHMPELCRSAVRSGGYPDDRDYVTGFRVVVAPTD